MPEPTELSDARTLTAQPAQWRRTTRPLRIALLGWARLSSQAWEGSGYNLSASDLARGLVMSGHEVFYMQSGVDYRIFNRSPRIVLREKWGGVACYDLLNSPNLSPAFLNFQNMASETSNPAQSALVMDWLDEMRVDVVHIHSLEGYGLDLIPAIRRGRSAPDGRVISPRRHVVVTPHNYWYVCPQVDLLYAERSVCMDYEGGRRCVNCLAKVDKDQVKRSRAVRQTIEEFLGPYTAGVVRHMQESFGPTLKRLRRGKLFERYYAGPMNPDRLVDPELPMGFEGVSAEQMTSPADGQVLHDLPLADHEHPRVLDACQPDTNERFVRATHHLTVLNDYGKRRVTGVESLNAASMVIPPSRFLLKAHVAMGLIEAKARWVRLGQPHFDQINRRARRSPFYNVSPWDPRTATRAIRFGFYGTTRNNKGLEVLLQAIPLLEREVRQRCQFNIRAMGHDWGLRKRMSIYPEVAFGGVYDMLQLISAGGEFDVGILPHIWFENSPLVMLEFLHAGKFVIASNLGGPPDWIKPNVNGLLFTGGRPDELAAHITSIVVGDVRVTSPREIPEASVLQSYPAHVKEVDEIYQELVSRSAAVTQAAAAHAPGA